MLSVVVSRQSHGWIIAGGGGSNISAGLRCVDSVSFNLQTGNHGKEKEVDMSDLKVNLLKCNSSVLCLQLMW